MKLGLNILMLYAKTTKSTNRAANIHWIWISGSNPRINVHLVSTWNSIRLW